MTVGRYLKSQREARGEDVPHVAEMLRIHKSYLVAIEENEIDKLPGPTYAVGFVRAYAEHLDLDGDQVVNRFKDEGKVLDNQTQLVFPSPLPEGQIPSGAILLLALVFLLVAYGGWVFVSSSKPGIIEMVPSLPDKIASMVGSDAPVATKPETAEKVETPKVATSEIASRVEQEPAKKADANDPNAGKPTAETGSKEETAAKVDAVQKTAPQAAVDVAPVAQVGADAPAEVAVVAPKPADASTPSASSEVIERVSENTDAPKPRDADVAVKVVPSDDLNAAVKSEDVATALALATSAPTGEETPAGSTGEDADSAQPPALPAPDSDDEPRVFGAPSAESRITIMASVDSWVEVRASDGELMLTRVLRVGDKYHVPDQSGLTLITGNAGGLVFEVDGAKVPEIGPMGTVRRNVSLDPTALKNGTAHSR